MKYLCVAAAQAGLFSAVLLGAAALAGCQRADRSAGQEQEKPNAVETAAHARVATASRLDVPRAAGPIKIDGELDEPDWTAAGRTGPFPDRTGAPARPFSEARFLWDERALYVTLYAADDDLRAKVTAHDGPVWTDDAFSLHLTPATEGAPTYLFDISPAGVTMDARRGLDGKDDVSWESGIQVAVDRDGTLNNPADEDEEWLIEAAIPFQALGVTPTVGTRISVDISRCDTPRGTSERRCSAFGTAKERHVLELSAHR